MVAEAPGMCVFSFYLNSILANAGPVVGRTTTLKTGETTDKVQDLQNYIAAVINGDPGIEVLQKLALVCLENPVTEPPSPPPSPSLNLPTSPSPFTPLSGSLQSLHDNIWGVDRNFDHLFNALMQFLDPAKVICLFHH